MERLISVIYIIFKLYIGPAAFLSLLVQDPAPNYIIHKLIALLIIHNLDNPIKLVLVSQIKSSYKYYVSCSTKPRKLWTVSYCC